MKRLSYTLAAILAITVGIPGLQAADGDLVYRATDKGTMTPGQAYTFFSAFVSAAGSEPLASTVTIILEKCEVDGVQKYCWKIVAEESDTSGAVKALIAASLSDPDYTIEVTGRCDAPGSDGDPDACD